MPASQVIDYAGLNIRFEPTEERNYYFTDEKPRFQLHVKNTTSDEVNIKVVWFLQTAVGRTGHDLIVDLKPAEEITQEIGHRLLGVPGWGLIGIETPVPPLPPVDPGVFPLDLANFHTLYTFQIFDRSVHNEQVKEQARRDRRNKTMLILGILTLIAVIISIVSHSIATP